MRLITSRTMCSELIIEKALIRIGRRKILCYAFNAKKKFGVSTVRAYFKCYRQFVAKKNEFVILVLSLRHQLFAICLTVNKVNGFNNNHNCIYMYMYVFMCMMQPRKPQASYMMNVIYQCDTIIERDRLHTRLEAS